MSAKAIVSRQQAIEQKLKFYFTGHPCCRGHFSERYASTGTCRACTAEGGRNGYPPHLANHQEQSHERSRFRL
jgi:hypothetical protein